MENQKTREKNKQIKEHFSLKYKKYGKSLGRLTVIHRIMIPPKDVYILILRTCQRASVHSKDELFADGIKFANRSS